MVSDELDSRQSAAREEPSLKPVILELVRTQHCEATLTLLLDKIHVVVSSQQYTDEDAYRVWLSDGERSIQAVFSPDLHPFLTTGDVREGTILVITKYNLIRASKHRSESWIWVLVVSDIEIGGFDGRANSGMLLEFRGEDDISTSTMRVEIAQTEANTEDSSGDTRSEVGIHQRTTRKRKAESSSHGLTSPKPKHKRVDSSPLSAKHRTRVPLQEIDANYHLSTPTKSIKFRGPLRHDSQERNLL